ncbi:nitroreductase family protein [candidate division KSB1 bacterium]|nr:nitroreductase family protein [candidate division KSB1 bacterium]
MDFRELVQERYSVRAFKADPVEQEKLDLVLAAARLAPTAANRQPFRIFVFDTKKHRAELQRLYPRDWFVQAPLVIGIVAVREEAWTRRYDDENYAVVDATIVFDHLILQAADLGLGTCWIAAFDPEIARQLLNLPQTWQPVAFTPLGYPADDWREKKRRDLTELVTFV